MGPDVLGRPGAVGLDPTKIVVDVRNLGTTGFAVCDWMRRERHVSLELAETRHVTGVITLADDEHSVDRLVRAFEDVARAPGLPPILGMPFIRDLSPELVLTPREAFMAPHASVPLAQAAGRVSAELVCPYPPGIPLLIPGERFDESLVCYLQQGMKAGMYVSASSDPSLGQVSIVA